MKQWLLNLIGVNAKEMTKILWALAIGNATGFLGKWWFF